MCIRDRSRLLADPLSGGAPSDLSRDAADEGWYWAAGECVARDALPFAEMQAQWQSLVHVLRRERVEVVFVDGESGGRFCSFTRDPAIAVKGGAIVGRLPAATRRGEQRWVSQALARLGMPVLRTVSGTGLMEGGSFTWVDPTCAAIGRSNCVNEEGARQVEQVLQSQGVEVLRVDLSFAEIHLDGVFAMVAEGLALADVARLPYRFLERLAERDIGVIPLGEADDRWIVNCLVVRPGLVLMPEGISGATLDVLHGHGLKVAILPFDKVHVNGGGIRCSTCPLIRDPMS